MALKHILDHVGRKAHAALIGDASWKKARQPFWHKGLRGLEFELHPGELIDYYIYTEGLFEKRFLLLIEKLLNGAPVALDIGANIGNHTLFMSTVFGEVHAFEPNPAVFNRLQSNVRRNLANNVHLHQFGLSDRNATLPFIAVETGNAGHSRFVSEASAEVTHSLEVQRGDDVIARLGLEQVSFIKADVEGHELDVFKGLKQTIAKHRPIIAFEFHPAQFPEGYFSRFSRALPGYTFLECDLRSGDPVAFIANGGLPKLAPLTVIEKESYPHILAMPA